MRIFLVCYRLDGKDAQTTHVIELFKNLKKKCEIICFASKLMSAKYKFPEIMHIHILNKGFFKPLSHQLAVFFYLVYYSIKLNPDVIYVRHFSYNFLPLIVSMIFKMPCIIEINGLIISEMKLSSSSRFFIAIVKFIERFNYKHATKIVAVTQGIKEGIMELYNIPDEKIVVIENGANTELFKPMDPKEVRKELNLDENYNYVGFSGSFAPWHGIEDLMRSAPLILKEVENTKFLLIGDGPMKEQIIQTVNDLNLTDNFIFINRVPYEEVPEYVNAFDVCVILKKKNIPGSPLKLWEYLACGKPVIATNTEDFRALEEYNAGILVDPEKPEEVADAIITLLKNKKLREEMGKNGRKYAVENRSWEAVAREVEKVMKEAASK